jgi:hypothetical protein
LATTVKPNRRTPPRRISLGGRTEDDGKMAIGKRRTGGESMPILKYDARAGTLFTQDRVLRDGSWQTEQHDVTDGFRAIFDLANVQIGWIAFPTGAPPDAQLFPINSDLGKPPSEKHKMGVRLLVKLIGDDDDDVVRELMSTAVAVWIAVDELHDKFLAELNDGKGVDQGPAAVPVVVLEDVVDTKTSYGVSRHPVFAIERFVPRPDDMPETPASRTQPPPPKKAKPAAKREDLDDEIAF